MDIKRWFGFFIFNLILLSLQAHPGIGLVYDGDRTIYYTDLDHVWQLDLHSGEARIYVENVHSHELALDAEGHLYGEHYWYEESKEQFWHYIWRQEKSGAFRKIREDRLGENLDFGFVRDENFASYEIRTGRNRFEIIKLDSLSKTLWHEIELNRPGWKYLSHRKELIFSDYPSVYLATPEGIEVVAENLSASRIPFSLQDKTHHIYGIWEDKAGTIYAALYGGRQVIRINSDKEIERVLKTGLLWSPVNGVFDKADQLWLMEARMDGAVRVRKIDAAQLPADVSFIGENIVFLIVLLLILGIIYLTFSKMISIRSK